jgi:hypothetical protein
MKQKTFAFSALLLSSAVLFSIASPAFSADSAAHPVVKEAPKKKAKKSYKITGGITIAGSTDRNAGVAPLADGLRGGEDDDDDEDEDEDDSFDDSDAFEDLGLDDEDAVDQLDEVIDEDGDGDFFDEDGPGEDEEGDLDGDGTVDALDADPDGDGAVVDAGVDPVAIVSPQAAVAGGNNRSRRDNRMTYSANLGYTQKIGGAIKEWKTAAKVATTDFNKLTKNDATLFGASTGPVFEAKSLHAQFQPVFVYAMLNKDGMQVFNNYGLGLNSQFKLAKDWKLNLRYGYDIRNFKDSKVSAITAHSMGTKLQYAITKKQAVSLGYTNRFEDTDFLALARTKNQHQVSLGYQNKWDNGIYFKPQVGYAFAERDAAAKRTQPVREDNRVTFNLALGVAFQHGINAELQYGSMATDANIDSKDTSNDRVAFVTGWKF